MLFTRISSKKLWINKAFSAIRDFGQNQNLGLIFAIIKFNSDNFLNILQSNAPIKIEP